MQTNRRTQAPAFITLITSWHWIQFFDIPHAHQLWASHNGLLPPSVLLCVRRGTNGNVTANIEETIIPILWERPWWWESELSDASLRFFDHPTFMRASHKSRSPLFYVFRQATTSTGWSMYRNNHSLPDCNEVEGFQWAGPQMAPSNHLTMVIILPLPLLSASSLPPH